MKKLKKPLVFLMILTIISSMFVPIMATASSVSETTLNIRTSTKYKYMNNWAYPNSRNGIHLATVAEGKYKGEPAYCIEFGKDMGDDGQFENIKDIDKVPTWEEFNANQKSGITRATIYGYPNFTYGVSAELLRLLRSLLYGNIRKDTEHQQTEITLLPVLTAQIQRLIMQSRMPVLM